MITPAERRLWDTHRGGSQRERTVRALLVRPGWHSITEIHLIVGFCRLNSRVAEARKVFKRDGHPFDIKHSIRDGEHGYELVPLAEPGAVSSRRVPGSASGSNLIPELGLPHAHEDGPLECLDNPAKPCPVRFPDWRRMWCPNCVKREGIPAGQGQLL